MDGIVTGDIDQTGLVSWEYSLLSQSASIGPVAAFTVPVSGVYAITAVTHIISTNGVGTLVLTVNATPSSFPNNSQSANLLVSPPVDACPNTRCFFMASGNTVNITVTLTGTVTTYSVFVSIIRLS
jgi:hypothetical protein